VEPEYAEIPGFEPVEATCDGLDNDCDGATDEGLDAPPSANQRGVCAGSVKTCGGSVGWVEPTTCERPGFEAVEATCDGLDNDCDGATDEGLVPPAQPGAKGVCAGVPMVCAGAAGWQAPDWETVPGYEAVEASCDGLDNDCDGAVDEELVAPAAAKGAEGVCAGTVQVCAGAAGWQEPQYAGLPGYEAVEVSCDGVDNDCDGQTDEGLVAPAAAGAWGVCAQAKMVCAGEAGWQAGDPTGVPGYELAETSCDGLDNDCDGWTDELTDMEAPAALKAAEGVCAGATMVCAPVGAMSGGPSEWQEPDYRLLPGYEAVEVSCDGLDNDCDGQTDEGLIAPTQPGAKGVCVGVPMVCGGAAGWQAPDWSTVSGYEVVEVSCDGLDNDCDGWTDEASDMDAPPAAKTLGVCTGMKSVCAGTAWMAGASPKWVEPDYALLVGYEEVEATCDGLDNDCDGETDEELVAPPASLHEGVCAGDVKLCMGAQGWQDPDPTAHDGYELVETSCDGLDNDCDGLRDLDDPDLVAVQPPLSNQEGVCEGVGQFCDGVYGWKEKYLGWVEGYQTDETKCDGLDNDCNGETDEDLTPPGATLHFGLCLGMKKTCEGVDGWVDPDVSSLPGYEEDETSCDGLDNDCDYAVDEGCPCIPGGKTKGVCAKAVRDKSGQCRVPASEGPYEWNETVCDGRDNDCDGLTDEASPPLAANQYGVCAGSRKECGGAAGWQEPNYAVLPGYEAVEVSCDGLDNDCDGQTDGFSPLCCAPTFNTGCVADSPTPVCNPDTQRCVPCNTDADCLNNPAGSHCGGHQCVQEGYVYVPPGTFLMGDPDATYDFRPHDVTLTRGYLIQTTEVTQGQWAATFPTAPSLHVACGPQCPVENVSWWDALAYANALSTAQGLEPCYVLTGCANTPGDHYLCGAVSVNTPSGSVYDCEGYRLPTSAEQERARRAGTVADFYGPLSDIAWWGGNAEDMTHKVGTKLPNAWGLYDMVGNVSEWVWDREVDYHSTAPVTDPEFGFIPTHRVTLGGGGYVSTDLSLLSAWHWATEPAATFWDDVGFRLVRSSPVTVQVEVCDGVDNDLDGVTDNHLTPPPATKTQGVCGMSFQVCQGGAGWADPDFSSRPGYEPVETTCDGLDNDCDGVTDWKGAVCCPTDGIGTCPTSRPLCNADVNECVECLADADCAGHPNGDYCSRHRCVPSGFEWLPSGDFRMPWTTDSEYAPYTYAHQVYLTKDVVLSATEVTQAQWQQRFGNNPSNATTCGADCPVEGVSWWDALAYANSLSESEGLAPCYDLSACTGTPGVDFTCSGASVLAPNGSVYECEGYRLPTEAEWEYGYREGGAVKTDFYDGPMTEPDVAPVDPNLDAIGWYGGNAGSQPHPVGGKSPNAWGLSDMAGNVREWVWERYGPFAYETVSDPQSYPSSGFSTHRVVRGGSYASSATYCTMWHREHFDRDTRDAQTGFRVARTLAP